MGVSEDSGTLVAGPFKGLFYLEVEKEYPYFGKYP